MKKTGFNNNNSSNAAHGGSSSSHALTGSAHGMLGGQSVGMNAVPNGHHSGMDMHPHQT